MLRLIDQKLLSEVATMAQILCVVVVCILFMITTMTKIHRLFSVIEPDSYLRPHKHESPDKVEIFICLQRQAALIEFAEDGRGSNHVVLEAGKVRGEWKLRQPLGI